MAKLSNTSATVIAITFMVMNLVKWLQKLFCTLIFDWQQHAEAAQKALCVFMAELLDLLKVHCPMQFYYQRSRAVTFSDSK